MKTLEVNVPDGFPQDRLDQLMLELNEAVQSISRFAIVACPRQLTDAQWHALRLDVSSLVSKAVGVGPNFPPE